MQNPGSHLKGNKEAYSGAILNDHGLENRDLSYPKLHVSVWKQSDEVLQFNRTEKLSGCAWEAAKATGRPRYRPEMLSDDVLSAGWTKASGLLS